MEPTATLKRTPFHRFHKDAGAKLVDFAGFEMPLRYAGDVREHQAVRTCAGLFDISHMGEFIVRGVGAAEFLDRALTNDIASTTPGQAMYTVMCRPDGGIVDDLYVYRSGDHFMLVVNASNIAKDFAWLRDQCPTGVSLTDRSDDTALLAVQGPKASDVLRGHVPEPALAMPANRFVEGPLFGVPATIARTGYTGEDGFELYFKSGDALAVWNGLIEAGRPHGLEPVGLGARDTLRLEMAYMLYGNDIDDTTSPLEAGLGWTVKLAKPAFTGRDALARQKEQGLTRRLVGLEAEGRRVPRHDMAVESGGRAVGRVTSGAYGPSVGKAVAMAYVDATSAALGAALEVAAGASRIPVRVVKRPFYTHGSRRAAG
ncbi:MAG: glycine cleavage system aminomethyltransferase GcvT [Candidatus Eisenbacteria bacterium]|uniref:Aminomethyltransferase n=1 Tax=Eiseniibacteriota bacterium TaxID=2212470 RepID=A0A9D6L8P1_UNCEI|nr:glycine cleavage system aminomethyltransferase GcvT [Candidatus Eisenbacteria bacterium]MBI3539700.1 glycine cleavage system aminomethyltransferase GcvT [Candidatus Eisenbacteria bacterium]